MNKANKKNKATIIIPTRNRPEYIKRILNYYNTYGTNSNIVITDVSSDEIKKQNKETISKLKNINVSHLDFTYSKDNYLDLIYKQMMHGIKHVKDKYCLICADDDFAIPNGIKQSVDFLEKNPDYSVVLGNNISFYPKINEDEKPQFYWRKGRLYDSITFPDAESRMEQYLSNYSHYVPSTQGIYRTSIMNLIYEETIKNADDVRFGEILPCMLTVVYGKLKRLDVFLKAREWIPGKSLGRTIEGFSDFVTAGTYDIKYSRFKSCLVEHLHKQSKISVNEAEKIIDKGWAAYTKRYNGFVSSKISHIMNNMPLPSKVDKAVKKTYKKMLRKSNQRNHILPWIVNATTDNPPEEYLDDFNIIKQQVWAFSKKTYDESED